MRTWSFLSPIAILLAFAAMAPRTVATEAKLVSCGTDKGKHGEKVLCFELTAPPDRPVFYIIDADTKIVLHEVQAKRGGVWQKVGNPWCANPKYPKLLPGKSTKFYVAEPEAKGPWRIGIKLYDAKPAANVRFTEVWSDVVR